MNAKRSESRSVIGDMEVAYSGMLEVCEWISVKAGVRLDEGTCRPLLAAIEKCRRDAERFDGEFARFMSTDHLTGEPLPKKLRWRRSLGVPVKLSLVAYGAGVNIGAFTDCGLSAEQVLLIQNDESLFFKCNLLIATRTGRRAALWVKALADCFARMDATEFRLLAPPLVDAAEQLCERMQVVCMFAQSRFDCWDDREDEPMQADGWPLWPAVERLG